MRKLRTIKKRIYYGGNGILNSTNWRNMNSYKMMTQKITQYKYYYKNKSSKEVLQLVELDSKPFGSIAEKIITEIFGLGPRTSTQNDATFNKKKIEIKCARYWAGKNECIWQHLEPEHDYDIVMFGLLHFKNWRIWCIKKEKLMGELRDKKIVTYQGKQGWWTKKSAIIKHLTPIRTVNDLIKFTEEN
jgi:hypothetical protein